MDVDLTIRYSDDRACEVVVCRPNEHTPLYRILTRRADHGESLTEAMREARRLDADAPWPDRRRRTDRALLANPGIGVTQIAHRLSVSPVTLYRYIPAARTANTPGA